MVTGEGGGLLENPLGKGSPLAVCLLIDWMMPRKCVLDGIVFSEVGPESSDESWETDHRCFVDQWTECFVVLRNLSSALRSVFFFFSQFAIRRILISKLPD